MNHQEISNYLEQQGYSVELDVPKERLTIQLTIGSVPVTLVHVFPTQIRKLPRFLIRDAAQYGALAHVEPVKDSTLAQLCVNDPDSVSINFDVPPLVYAASLERHIDLLTRVMTDPQWNRAELIREFRSNWDLLCWRSNTSERKLFVAYDPNSQDACQVKGPVPRRTLGIPKHYLGLGETQSRNRDFGGFHQRLCWGARAVDGKTVLLEFDQLEPAPLERTAIADWFMLALGHLSAKSEAAWLRARKQRSKVYWIICTALTPVGRIWSALRLRSGEKCNLPATIDECDQWHLDPIPVRGLDRDSVVPRGGGRMDLTDKSVLLIGCGSVGSELAHRLASTGIGQITMSDADTFSQDNLYRHTLAVDDIEYPKTFSLAIGLRGKYPWIRATEAYERLEAYTDVDALNQFDLILVAIGAPTLERQFAQFVASTGVTAPVLNVWLEAYGVGGHAALSLPNHRGCLLCAYVNPEDFSRGLVSNLNFLAPDQDVTRSHGGCGNLYMPYSAIASNHTATIAADLAVRYLSGNLAASSRVSWKGEDTEAVEQGLSTTYRYRQFNDSLIVKPLAHPECDACGG